MAPPFLFPTLFSESAPTCTPTPSTHPSDHLERPQCWEAGQRRREPSSTASNHPALAMATGAAPPARRSLRPRRSWRRTRCLSWSSPGWESSPTACTRECLRMFYRMQRSLPSLPLKRTVTLTRICHNFHQIPFQENIYFDLDMSPNILQISQFQRGLVLISCKGWGCKTQPL